MASIKSIKVGENTYDLKATYDSVGNVINTTYAKKSIIPTKVSQLQNDSNYLTEHQDISTLATKSQLNNKVDKVEGKGLSEADYTKAEKTKLSTVAENANNYVHPTTAGNKHIPAGGASGQILVYSANGAAKWADSSSKIDQQFTALNTAWKELQEAQQKLDKQVAELNSNVDLYSYGVEWDVTVASPKLTRIGNPILHKSLPIQSAYKGCVAEKDKIKYYLFPDDWSYKEDGTTPSVLDGTDGTVRVHTPKFYGKSGSNGNKRWVRTSTVKIDDSWIEIPELLIDAYKSTVDKTDPDTPKAVSVVNTTPAFRGGGDRANFDEYLTTELDTKDIFRSDLGKPRTSINRTIARTYAVNAGSELLCYEYYKWIFYWNYVIEYANFNSQDTYNAELTVDGYRQGGLGVGVTNWSGVEMWVQYNAKYPITPCGYCNEFGNFTGVKDLVIPESTTIDGEDTITTRTFKVSRWRGFDNVFGDIWTILDGVVIVKTADNKDAVYTTTKVSEFTDKIGTKTITGYQVSANGFIKSFEIGKTAEIIPSAISGDATTYMCDYCYNNATSKAVRMLMIGGTLTSNNSAGLSSFSSGLPTSFAASDAGFRTLNRIS